MRLGDNTGRGAHGQSQPEGGSDDHEDNQDPQAMHSDPSCLPTRSCFVKRTKGF